jgi:hypothetical protein
MLILWFPLGWIEIISLMEIEEFNIDEQFVYAKPMAVP